MTADELRELQELAFQLEELTKHEGWAVLRDYCNFGDGMLAHHQKYLLNGLCKSTDEYQKYAGWVQGASAVLAAPQKVREMANRYSVKAGEQAG